jgi:EmrB/QacA subfamily drug resistance transporter
MADSSTASSAAAINKLEVPRRQALSIFAVVSLALIMSSINTTIVAVSLPAMLKDLETNLAYAGWIITGYNFSTCVIMPIIGKISDDWGRKRIFLIAVIVFTVSSLAAGLSPNIYWTIIFRVIQGIGGGAFLPSATGMISDAFGKNRATAVGLFASIFPIGGVIGPNIGGFIIDHLSWRWIFFVNIPLGVLLVIFGFWVLPSSKTNPIKHRIDFAGAGLFAGAILAVLYAMTVWADNPQGVGTLTWSLFALAAILIVIFTKRENRIESPIIELKLLRWRPFLAANIFNFFYGAIIFGPFALIPYYATVSYGMTAIESGIVVTPRSVAMIVFAAITSFFVIRFRYRLPMIIGTILMSVSFFLFKPGLS